MDKRRKRSELGKEIAFEFDRRRHYGGTDAFLQFTSLVPAIGRPGRAAYRELIREKKQKSIPASFLSFCLHDSASRSDLPIIQQQVPETLRHPANQNNGGKIDCGS